MAITYHKGGAIEHLAVEVCLTTEPPQAVTVGFDFVPVERPVNDRQVYPHLTATETKLLEQNGIGVAAVSVL